MLTEDELNKLKLVQLEIMDFFHSICIEYGIKYSLAAGTCIGAVRHKGFIPWDFDIDICMIREEYDKLDNALSKTTNDKFKYINYKNEVDYYRPHAIIIKKGTAIFTKFDVLNNPLRYNHGIYIDIIPLDCSDGYDKDKTTIQIIQFLKLLLNLRKGYHYSPLESKFKTSLRKILSMFFHFIPLYFLNYALDRLYRSKNNKDTNYYSDYTSKYSHNKSVWNKSVFSKYKLQEFEGRKYYIMERYDDYLTTMYGDYMKIPNNAHINEQKKVFSKVVFEKE